MKTDDYLSWLSCASPTSWWHDSADPDELDQALSRGAVGVTTNPILVYQALKTQRGRWTDAIGRVLGESKNNREKAEALMRLVVMSAAEKLVPVFERTAGESGYVCAQVDPSLAGDRMAMYEMAKRFSRWAPNIAVKLPVTSAGLDVLEKCSSEGITVTATVSFTVPQAIAVGERFQKVQDSRRAGQKTGRCFAVMMIGRLDDYLREIFADSNCGIHEAELLRAGLAAVKHAHEIYRKKGLQAKLMVAAFRGNYQVAELCGADAVMSIHPKYQKSLLAENMPHEKGIDRPVQPSLVKKLLEQNEFRRAYEAGGLSEKEFAAFGLTQRTLSQFSETGWKLLEGFRAPA